ncbi:MAG: hypothetical protein K2N16_10280 [Muribaculaceae bacterium]|nr:hypothetical protein [Muribaculaceae bacterium]
MNQYKDYYSQQDQYYGQPQPKPVSLQPFKTLKIVFLVLAIVNTVSIPISIIYMIAVGNALDTGSVPGIDIRPLYSTIGSAVILLEVLPFAIAFWVLYGVFNKKYKERVEQNRALGYMIE